MIREVLTWGEDPEIDEYYDNLLDSKEIEENIKVVIKNKKKQIKKILRILHQRLIIEKIISYYKIG